jgi:hypothetical protein
VRDLHLARSLLLFAWAFGLGGVEVEIEGGYGWAERMPTWFLKRGRLGALYGMVMGHRPLTGYHVYVFIMPLIILNLPFGYGVPWSLAGELMVFATFFALAVVWDYTWFVLNPAYTVRRFQKGNVWWFEQPWIWRFPLDYYMGIALSVTLAALAAWRAGSRHLLYTHLWMLAVMAVLIAVMVVLAPFYHRWYRHMRREGADDRAITNTYGPPAPQEVWSGGTPDLHPLGNIESSSEQRRES